MNDLRSLIVEILEKGYLMSLATVDEGGVWVSDVIYLHDDELNLYWMSDPSVRHSKALLKHPQVAGTITINAPGEDNLGLQFSGRAEKIDGPRLDLAIKHMAKRGKPAPKTTDDVLQGDSWYMVKVDFFDIICERLFGFEKKRYENVKV